jgi:cytochrome c oxidase subunit II
MRIKQDAIPGLTIPVWFTPTVTTAEIRERTGRDDYQYEIVCNQLCGIGHYRMKGYMTIETEEEFEAWLESQAPVEGGGDDFWG